MAKRTIKITEQKLKQLANQLPAKLGELLLHGHNDVQALIKLYEEAERKGLNTFPLAELSLRSCINVRLISFIESFLKQSYADLIDNDKFVYNGLIELDFKSLIELRDPSTKLTNGQIVARELNFQNFDDDNGGHPIALRYFEELTGTSVYGLLMKKNSAKTQRWISEIRILLENRHLIIHDLQHTLLTIKNLKGFEASLVGFLLEFNRVTSTLKP